MLASVPAAGMFTNAGVSILDNAGVFAILDRMDISSLIQFYGALLLLPPVGSAIGAKIGGRMAEVQYMIGRGIGGQVIAFLCLGFIFSSLPGLESNINALSISGQTIATLMLLQVGCTLGTVWGI